MNFLNATFLLGVISAVALLALYLGTRSIYQIEQGNLAVLSRFGRLDRSLIEPGLHLKLPWDRVHEFSVMKKVIDVAGTEGALQLMTEDGTLLKLVSRARLRISPEKFYSFLFELKRPTEHVQELVRCLLRNEIANFTSAEEGAYAKIRKNMPAINRDIKATCDTMLHGHYGIDLSAVDLTDVVPPQELAQALNALEKTRADVSALFTRALADSEQKIEAARQGIEIANLRAESVARELEITVDTLFELDTAGTLQEYVEQRRVEVYSDSKLSMVRRTQS